MPLMQLAEKVRSRLQALLSTKPPVSAPVGCCISLTANKFLISCNDATSESGRLPFSTEIAYEEPETLLLVLKSLVEKKRLEKIPTSWLLQPIDYQFFILEALPVADDELQDALRWRLKNLISYPIEEAVMDYFFLPKQKNGNAMLAVTTAHKPLLQPTINLLQKAGFNLKCIGIPEVALRKLAAFYENDNKTSAFIYFFDSFVILNISCQGNLFFSRRISGSLAVLSQDPESFVLEIQRYFDYFQSQWRQPGPSRIWLAADNDQINTFLSYISKYLTTPIQIYRVPPSVAANSALSGTNPLLLTWGNLAETERAYA